MCDLARSSFISLSYSLPGLAKREQVVKVAYCKAAWTQSA